jgi:hypothetical protein
MLSTIDGQFKCDFAASGTYGHECGAPATMTAVKKSNPIIGMSSGTVDGLFYAHRCERCAKIKGGENVGLLRIIPLDPVKHVNRWK